jgi:NAD dependent epimerase/dehydratase
MTAIGHCENRTCPATERCFGGRGPEPWAVKRRNIGEDRPRTRVGDRVHSGHERHRGHHHLVAGTETAGYASQMQGSCAASDGEGMTGPHIIGECFLEPLRLWTHAEPPRAVDLGDDPDIVLCDPEIGERDSPVGHLSILSRIMDLEGRLVLVTGAGGFIGGNLASKLISEGARVRGFVRYNSRNDRGTLDWLDPAIASEIEVVAGELRDLESVSRAIEGVDVVFHLGAQIAIPYSYVNPRDFFEVNALGSLNVAQAGRAAGVERIVHASSSEVYGTARYIPITEEHPLEPQSPYAASKVAADKLMESFHRSFDLPVTIVRPFNTYGPFQSARAVVPTVVSQVLAGGPLRLGSLHPRRDLTFVDDTAAGFIAAARAEEAIGRTLQLGTGTDVGVWELVELVGELINREPVVEHDAARVRPPRSEVERLISSPALAAELLGWRPTVPLREGLLRTIDWIERNLSRYRVDQYVI